VSSTFQITFQDQETRARTGTLETAHGPVETPVFMPVGTQAAVKTLTPGEVRDAGTSILLTNTYHLLLRPGVELIEEAGGVHRFMGWDGPILTDSGGFQVFSLSEFRKVTERGVEFRSHHDGRKMELTPESVVDLQSGYQSDIMMPLDELAGYEDSVASQRSAAERTIRWLDRAKEHLSARRNNGVPTGLLFGIAQGGFDPDYRAEQARLTAEREMDGYSIGGLSVGESKAELLEMLDSSLSGLPENRPRYLMGVGSPEDLWEAVQRGVDMFDCVHPTRVARRGALFTREGRVNITAARYRRVFDSFDHECDCMMCRDFSAAYVHHLFRSGEMLAQRLASIHNLRFLHRMTEEMRNAIRSGDFTARCNEFLSRYRKVDEQVTREQRERWKEHQRTKHGQVTG
jgi:queuine tRNA-ribosyltransferase